LGLKGGAYLTTLGVNSIQNIGHPPEGSLWLSVQKRCTEVLLMNLKKLLELLRCLDCRMATSFPGQSDLSFCSYGAAESSDSSSVMIGLRASTKLYFLALALDAVSEEA
jgi:hypothetical protein